MPLANCGDDCEVFACQSVNALCRIARGACLLALSAVLGGLMVTSAEARTTRTFSGSNPGEVEKNARRAGFDYPDGEMQCSSRCTQRWAKE